MLLIPLCESFVRSYWVLQLGELWLHALVLEFRKALQSKKKQNKNNPLKTPRHPSAFTYNSVALFAVCAAWAKMSQCEWGRRKCNVRQSTRGQCEIPAMLAGPTNSPPTWNNSHKTCCGLPISAGCFLPWSDYRGRTEPQCAYEGWGGDALCRAVQQGLLFDLGGKRFSSARNVFSDPRT